MTPAPCIPVCAKQRVRHRGYAGAAPRVRWLWSDARGRLMASFWSADGATVPRGVWRVMQGIK